MVLGHPWKDKACQLCGTTYTPSRSRDRYCPACRTDAVQITKHFNAMHRRIRDSWKEKYKIYRGRDVAEVWKTGNHVAFIRWSVANGWKKGLMLDRVDGRKGYSPHNCRYVTAQENSRNQVKHVTDGVRKTRRCRICHVVKGFDAFYPNRGKAYGIDYSCAECTRRINKAAYHAGKNILRTS